MFNNNRYPIICMHRRGIYYSQAVDFDETIKPKHPASKRRTAKSSVGRHEA